MIKANASCVISDLGGGQHGHLDLVIPDAKYNRITGCTYIKPTHPGHLKIKENTPLHEAINYHARSAQQNIEYFP